MKTCEYAGEPLTEPRAHPWSDSVANAEYRYHDLKAMPALIRTSLEDFVPWGRYGAVEQLYSLLEWLNGPGSPFESNDCAFIAPHANDAPSVPRSLTCSGRVMLLYRDLPLNVSQPAVRWFKHALHHALGALEPELEWGLVGTTLVPVRYLALPRHRQLGQQLMVSFWAWGSTEADLMGNLERVLTGLFAALRQVSNEL